MNFEAFVIEPEPGHVVEIHTLHLYHFFLTGYCRSVIQTPTHLHFLGGFKRISNVDLTHCRAEPHEWECVPVAKASIGFSLEQPWMRLPQPPERNIQ